jgi:hypothetical protein
MLAVFSHLFWLFFSSNFFIFLPPEAEDSHRFVWGIKNIWGQTKIFNQKKKEKIVWETASIYDLAVLLVSLGPRKPHIEVDNIKSQILAKFIHRGGTREWLFLANSYIFVRMLKAKCHREPKISRITAGFIRVLADLTGTHSKFIHFCHIWCVPFGFCNPMHTNFVRTISLFFSKIHTFWLPTYFGGFLGPVSF